MCFQISRLNTEVKIADKDIICYKIGNLRNAAFLSEIRMFIYKQNILYKSSCLSLNEYKAHDLLNRGFHSFISQSSSVYDIVKFIIPKGSRYMINTNDGEYISNQIIWK